MSLKLKNYALLAYDGTMTMKGASLRSRRMEPCIREFLKEAAYDFMRDQRDEARERLLNSQNSSFLGNCRRRPLANGQCCGNRRLTVMRA